MARGACCQTSSSLVSQAVRVCVRCLRADSNVLEHARKAHLATRQEFGLPDAPPLIASTLLVPGYVDEEEVSGIACFVASLNPEIPYRLLAFHPDFRLRGLPATSRSQAERACAAAAEAGLSRVSIGNLHLLG